MAGGSCLKPGGCAALPRGVPRVCRSASSASMAAMTGPRIRVVLDLDPVADPIGGLISVGDGPATPFSGWLQLAEALPRGAGRRVGGTPPAGGARDRAPP